jgi:hypothetical protein
MKRDYRKTLLTVLAGCLVLAAPSPAHPQTPTSSIPYVIPNRGAVTIETLGSSSTAVVGEGRVQPASSTTPSGASLLRYRQSGVLISESAIPGMTAMTSGRTYAEINGPTGTGVAFVNPTSVPVMISFAFMDQFGNEFGQSSFSLDGNAQIARFLNEAPFNAGTNFIGTFSFSASAPVGVVALRTFVNERSELLVTPQTTGSVPGTAFIGTLILPHFAEGGGWKTQLFLVNTTDAPINGFVQFFSDGTPISEAVPLTLTVNGQVASLFNYSIRARSSISLETTGASAAALVGSVRISPTGGSTVPSSFAVLSLSRNGVAVSLTTEQAQLTGTAFRSYVEVTSPSATVGAIQTGIAIANNSAASATVNFELLSSDTLSAGPMASVQIGGFGHVARFVHELYPSLTLPFRGVLRISSFSTIAVLAVLSTHNERGDTLITSLPASNEGSVSSTAELLFPQLVDGGGYTTQFVLFSGITGQSSTGTLVLLGQQGQGLNVGVR